MVDDRHQGGEVVARDAGSLLPGVLPPEFGASVVSHEQTRHINIRSEPPPPPPPCLGLFSIFVLPFWRLGIFRFSPNFLNEKVFGVWNLLDLKGSLQLLNSTHLRDRDKMLLRAILCGRVWNGFLLGNARKEDVPCRFCGKKDGDGHLFCECSFPPLQHVRDLPEFSFLMSLNRSRWPRCLLWHGWLPGLNGMLNDKPWALSFGELASFHLERCLGAYPVDFCCCLDSS